MSAEESLSSLTKLAPILETNRKRIISAAGDPQKLKKVRASLNAAQIDLNRAFQDDLFFLLGVSFEAEGNSLLALQNYEKSLSFDSNNPPVLYRKAVALFLLDRKKDSKITINELNWARGTETACSLLLQARLSDSGIAYAEKALVLDSNSPEILQFLLEEHVKKIESTKEGFEKLQLEGKLLHYRSELVRVAPDNRDASLALGNQLLRSVDPLIDQDKIERVKHLARKLVNSSNYSDEQSVKLLIDSYLKGKQIEAAEEALKSGLEANPDSKILSQAKVQLEIEKKALNIKGKSSI